MDNSLHLCVSKYNLYTSIKLDIMLRAVDPSSFKHKHGPEIANGQRHMYI